MWLTATRGICHATAKPFAVSRPVIKDARIPGPRVTVMKSGSLLEVGELLEDWVGRYWTDLLMRVARLFW